MPFGLGFFSVAGAGAGIKSSYIAAVSFSASPAVWPWTGTALGTKYADAASPASGFGWSVDFAPSLTAIACGSNSSPFIQAWAWSSAGFGTKFSNPSDTALARTEGIKFHPNENAVAVSYENFPGPSHNLQAYAWSSSGWGTRFANPGTRVDIYSYDTTFSPNGNYVAATSTTSPYIFVYDWSTSGFGSKIANPGTLPAGEAYGVAFSPNNDYIAVAHRNSPAISIYPWTTGFGSKIANPATVPPGQGNGVAFSPNGNFVAIAASQDPFLNIYGWSGSGFGTRVVPTYTSGDIGGTNRVSFSAPGDYVAIAHDNGGNGHFVSIFSFNGTTLGTRSGPSTGLSGTSTDVEFSIG